LEKKISLILFLTLYPRRVDNPTMNFSFQKDWFESSQSMKRVREVFVYHWKSLSFFTSKVGKEFNIFVFEMRMISYKM